MKVDRIVGLLAAGLAAAACSSSHTTDAGTALLCNPACGTGLTCLAGSCAPTSCSQSSDCPAGFSCQGGFCTNAECAMPCASSQICVNGGCVNKNPCGPHEVICGSGPSAYCSNLSQDGVNCGTCGQACPSGEVCARGACQTSCLQNETECGSLCVDTQTDNQNCGACGKACAKGTLCSDGQCAATCSAPDATVCGTAQAAYCADIYVSPFDCGGCGTTCGAGEYCSQGICQARCGGLASQLCDGICVDLQTDLENCGACGHACKSGLVCYGGECVATCGFPLVTCSLGTQSYCANLFEDALNCGSCGQTCAVGQVCSSGVCASACASGTPCNGVCTNLQTDGQNCGTCGAVCPAGSFCDGFGQCSPVCGVGYTACGSGTAAYCANVATDPANCGACGTLCPGGGACSGGSCADGGVGPGDGGMDGGSLDSGVDAGLPCGGCGPGLVCVGSVCRSQSCEDRACLPGFACVDAGCVQPSCATVTCPANQACANGQCFTLSCSGGTCDGGVCWNDTCVETSCAGISCVGSEVCSAGTCHPACAAGCSAPQVCIDSACQPGCTISGQTYQAGALNPDDLCQVCDPTSDPGGWTAVSGGNACGSGNVCTGSGSCTAGCAIGAAGYPAGAANPADVCQVCNPLLSVNGWSAGNDNVVCGTGEVCRGGACIAGCAIAGFVLPGTLSPNSPCQSCQPMVSVTSYSPLPDGTGCHDTDGNVFCKGGLCSSNCSGSQGCPSANDVCQASVCTPGCLIGGTFYPPGAADSDGGGIFTDGGPIPLCCAPSLSTGSWTPEWASEGYGAGAGVLAISAAELGGPNGIGVVTANYNAGTASVLYNNGDGTLSAPAAYDVGLQPFMAGVGDVTGDGIPDIVAMGPNNTTNITVAPGRVGGTFGPATTAYAFNYGATMLGVAAHFFPTGAPAAVITTAWNSNGGPLQVLGQAPDGGLQVVQSSTSTFFWSGPNPGQQLVIMDLNGDGLDDLAATTDSYTHFTTVLLNNAAGNLGNESDYLLGHGPNGLAAASIFGKHFPSGAPVPDLVTFDGSVQKLIVLQNNGNGNFVPAGSSPVLAVTGVVAVAAGDFNGDGWGDAAILIYDTSPYTVQIFLGDGSGNLTPGPSFPVSSTVSNNAGMAMLGGPFGYNGAAGFFSMTDSSTITLWQDVCQ